MTRYRNILRGHAYKSYRNIPSNPSPSLAIGEGEKLAPNIVPVLQVILPEQKKPTVQAIMHYSQNDQIKSMPYLTEDSFPKSGVIR